MSPVSSSQPVGTVVSRIDRGLPQKTMLYVMKSPVHGGKEMAANHRARRSVPVTCHPPLQEATQSEHTGMAILLNLILVVQSTTQTVRIHLLGYACP